MALLGSGLSRSQKIPNHSADPRHNFHRVCSHCESADNALVTCPGITVCVIEGIRADAVGVKVESGEEYHVAADEDGLDAVVDVVVGEFGAWVDDGVGG